MSTTTTTTTNLRRPAPLRVMRQLVWRIWPPRAAAAPIEAELFTRQLDREEQAITAAAAESVDLEAGLEVARRQMSAALTDPVSPGIITETEARGMAGTLINTAALAHTHTARLRAML